MAGPNFTDSRLCGHGGIQYGKAAGVDESGQVPHDNPDEKTDDFRPQTKQVNKKSLDGFRMAKN